MDNDLQKYVNQISTLNTFTMIYQLVQEVNIFLENFKSVNISAVLAKK